MGKTAVIIDSSKTIGSYHHHLSQLFLGACSEPNMKWQLVVQIVDSEQNIQSYFFNFETHY
ncbi:hypothetical protein RS130_15380 [Paraglaciecola aquimarina]|uniref:Uncharacterized protein n=1 Tax=Paraglaciecola aquimarina TaxID=1235557 RepID=A0ABU3SYM1_9ALTE|nr:hypothetical protein [Paraglaciecola aquimarina]MDU0355096.1 hypothetical protein [Paraglaciecola aquimarina]